MDAIAISPWFLLGYPLLFLLGWLASRIDYLQLKIENKESPKAYFKGLNLLLDEQQDEAIDAFIEAVQNDPDTSDLHFALGRLFRRRGEYQRAIRIHQHLLMRGDLPLAERERAQYALAQDYLKAGILNLAQEALTALLATPYEVRARQALLGIFERCREWDKAAEMAQALTSVATAAHLEQVSEPSPTGKQRDGNLRLRHMHFLCESAKELTKKSLLAESRKKLDSAQSVCPEHPRPLYEKSLLAQTPQELNSTFDALVAFAADKPQSIPYLLDRLKTIGQQIGRVSELQAFLQVQYERSPSWPLLQTLNELQNDAELAKQRWKKYVESSASILAAHQWLRAEYGQELFAPANQAVIKAIDKADAPLLRYRCSSCGFETKELFWQCPGCLNWDSYPASPIGATQ